MSNCKIKTVYEVICILNQYWIGQGCIIVQPLDIPIGAGTFHPETFFNVIKSNVNFAIAYVQPCRRPSDGRYANNPNRLQYYYQFQVIINPPPKNIQQLYINSLKELSIDPTIQDIRFIEDDWENPTLGASGVGWEVWINGMEITQFTYFQQMGSLECNPITIELTYGLERISMHLQNVNDINKLIWMQNKEKKVTYKELFYENELEQSSYNFVYSNTELLLNLFLQHVEEANRLVMLQSPLVIPAYEHVLQATHNFNLLDSKKVLSIHERQHYIFMIRNLTKKIATIYCSE